MHVRRIRFIASVLLVGALALPVGAMSGAAAHGRSGGSPDTYVTSWDAVGTQAFTAAALSPAEGHTIFAYVSIAVYDSVMAIEGGYKPFMIHVHAPEGASAEAAVAAAAHGILKHYLPAQAPTIIDPAYVASLATIDPGQAKTDGVATGEKVASKLIDEARRRRLPGGGDLHAAEPADPRRVAPDGPHAADRHLPRAHAAVQPRVRRPVPAERAS